MATKKYTMDGDLTINSLPMPEGTITLGTPTGANSSLGQEDVAILRIMTDRMKELILEGKLDTTVRTRLRFLFDSEDEHTMVILAGYIHKLMNNPIIKNRIMGEL